MKRISLFTLCLLVWVGCCRQAVAQRVKYNFNLDWQMVIGEPVVHDSRTTPPLVSFDRQKGRPESVTLPHALNEHEAFRVRQSELTDTMAWYYKTFTLDAEGKIWLNDRVPMVKEQEVESCDRVEQIRYPGSGVWWRDALRQQEPPTSRLDDGILPRRGLPSLLGRVFLSLASWRWRLRQPVNSTSSRLPAVRRSTASCASSK